MAKHHAYARIAKLRVQVPAQRRDVRDDMRGRASRYRNYGEALRAIASHLRSPKIRKKLLLVAEEFSEKAAAMEAIKRSHRAVACKR